MHVCRIHLKQAYLGVQQRRSITITNTSRLPLQFSWMVQQLQPHCRQSAAGSSCASSGDSGVASCGGDSYAVRSIGSASSSPATPCLGAFGVSMFPAAGRLEPQESQQLQLLLEPQRVGAVTLLCSCVVPAMSQLVGFVVTAVIEGLQVAFELDRPVRQGCWVTGAAASSSTSSSVGASSRRLPSPSSVTAAAAAARVPLVAAGAMAEPGTESRQSEILSEPLLADFGVVAAHQPSELVLRVTNLTSIGTSLRAWVCRFPAATPTAVAAAAAVTIEDSGSTQGVGIQEQRLQQQQQQLGMSSVTVSQGASQPSFTRSMPGYGLPVSTLPASPAAAAPAQQQQQSSIKAEQLSSVQQQQRRTFSPQQQRQQQQQQPGIAARLAAAVSGGASGAVGAPCSGTKGGVSLGACSGTTGELVQHVPGPFRSTAGNSMMAARKVVAAAQEALGERQHGCAVCIQPCTAILQGWGSLELRLVAYNNLLGTYVDHLCVQVRVD